MFTDIVGSTQQLAAMGDGQLQEFWLAHNAVVARELAAHGGRQINTTGDGFLATFDDPAQAIVCARAVRQALRPEVGLEIRAGLHLGQCLIVDGDVVGVAINVAARVMGEAN